MNILILCTGNSCRSQMAHGFLAVYNKALKVFSAGTQPDAEVNPLAVKVMEEKMIDISDHKPHNVSEYLNQDWDYVITVCSDADANCPTFVGNVKHRLCLSFDDPSKTQGSPEFVESEFRRVRDAISRRFYELYRDELKDNLGIRCTCGANDFCRCE